MKKKLNNIKVKLILAFVLILIIPSITVGVLSYNTAKSAVEHEIVSGIEQSINLLNSTIDNTIKPKTYDIDYFSQTTNSQLYQDHDSPELRMVLDQYISIHPEAQTIYLGTENGVFVQEPRINNTDEYDPRTRDWYIQAMERKGEMVISSPYADAGTNEMVITVSKSTADGNGVVAVDIFLTYLKELTKQVKIGEEGYALLLDENKKIIAHPTNAGGSEATEEFYNEMYEKEQGTFTYVLEGKDKMMSFDTNELTGWKIAGNLYTDEINKATSPIYQKTLIVIIVALLIGAVVIFFILKSIMKPIKELKDKVMTISKGDLTEKIRVKTNDEIGHLGTAFNEMIESLRTLVKKVESNATSVTSSAEELTASAEQTTESTEQVSRAIQEVSISSEKQTSGVEQTAKAIDDVAQGISFISNSAVKVSELSRHTMTHAKNGGKAVTSTVNQMISIQDSVLESNVMIQSLKERSKEVSSILSVITGISDQTNLLSLNAAIEAARAGEHGRGFSVVAEEVRKLAEQSQQSAKEIDQIVQGIQEEIDKSVQLMVRVTEDVESGVQISHDAIEKFKEILKGTEEITPQMEGISATSQQISASIQEVNATANELSFIAQENAVASEEVAASTEEQLASMQEISASAQSLSKMAEELTESIAIFKY